MYFVTNIIKSYLSVSLEKSCENDTTTLGYWSGPYNSPESVCTGNFHQQQGSVSCVGSGADMPWNVHIDRLTDRLLFLIHLPLYQLNHLCSSANTV